MSELKRAITGATVQSKVIPFAGLRPELETFIERSTPPDASCLDRWKQLEREGWEVEALVADDGSTMVGLGCRYAHALANAAGAPASA